MSNSFADGLAAAVAASPELAGITDPEFRQMVAREVAQRAGFRDGGPAIPVADAIASVRKAEPWWWTDKPTEAEQPHSGPNPWKTGNVTDQCRMMNDNPNLAARMQAEAGK